MKTLFGLMMIFFFLLLPFLLIGFVVWLIRKSASMNAQKFSKIASALSGEVVKDAKGNPIYVRVATDRADVRIFTSRERPSASDDSPPNEYLVMQLMLPLGFTMFLSRDNAIFKLFGKLGAVTDINVGDPEFDKKFLIRSDTPAPVIAYLQNPDRRAAIYNLEKKHFQMLIVRPDCIEIRKMYFPNPDLIEANLVDYIASLKQLVD